MANSYPISTASYQAAWYLSNSGILMHDLFSLHKQMEADRLGGYESGISPILSTSTLQGAVDQLYLCAGFEGAVWYTKGHAIVTKQLYFVVDGSPHIYGTLMKAYKAWKAVENFYGDIFVTPSATAAIHRVADCREALAHGSAVSTLN
ncbi:hypothetical protein K438DRAFT_1986405 [Mycena galopus ATCC 62051]|nr:hypothetical protein K438DRAFT_1986405 [Mycena galopus ATCC 62051]